MGKQILRKVRNHFVLLFGGALCGVLLLLAAHCLPTAPIQEHVLQSLPMLEREFFRTALVVWIVALYPFVWFFLTQNHSGIHWVFTNKILTVTVFAGICGIGKLCGGDK